MDSTTLKTFVTIAELGSFSMAAEQLHLTQPAISKRIASLEQELETRLFDRISRQITLTEAGRILYQRAHHILQELDDSRREIANLAQHVSGRLTIATSHHIGLHRLPPVLKTYVASYPDVELDIRFMDSEAACYAVQHGDLELAIVTLPLEYSDEIKTKVIWQDPLSLVIGPTHPLRRLLKSTNGKHALRLEELLTYSAILPGETTFTRQLIMNALQDQTSKLKVGMSTNYLETIKMLVSVGLGWSVLPQSMIDKDLLAVSVRGFQLKRQLGIVWHASRTLSNACHAMIRTVVENPQ